MIYFILGEMWYFELFKELVLFPSSNVCAELLSPSFVPLATCHARADRLSSLMRGLCLRYLFSVGAASELWILWVFSETNSTFH